MKKNDFVLVIVIILIASSFILFNVVNKKKVNKAYIYFESKLVKTVDLNIDSNYEVDGYNGKVKIEVKNNKIRVIEENSNYHLCSKQGFIEKSYESIICLPNKIVIKLDSNLDAVVK